MREIFTDQCLLVDISYSIATEMQYTWAGLQHSTMTSALSECPCTRSMMSREGTNNRP